MNKTTLATALLVALSGGLIGVPSAQFVARDPGLRGGPAGAGGALNGLSSAQKAFFVAGLADFEEREGIADGLGPRFNLDSCGGCHLQPANGGSSPAVNPQVAIATFNGARNVVPSFITKNGPVREARFVRNADGTPDGGVHALFVISGRNDRNGPGSDASGCTAKQEDFETQVRNKNVIFRIPTPTFGLGLIEQISDSDLVANQAAAAPQKAALGIGGRFNRTRTSSTNSSISGEMNRSGNDGTITRFGWKAQNKSLLIFSGEAYNVEMGITNDAFQNERDENPTCQFVNVPNDTVTDDGDASGAEARQAIELFTLFMRFSAAPTPSPNTPGGTDSIGNGRKVFTDVGCALCHTPTLYTSKMSAVSALRSKPVNLFSDLMLHAMGPGLADGVSQGAASGDEFRTAPLWGLGQRIFFLHDGRTNDLAEAIQAHRSGANATYPASEANGVINNYNSRSERDKQDLLNFLRSL
jgi:CxxC motif-containing protein (DUF1111 family)